jgi:probable DNA metabolism protein
VIQVAIENSFASWRDAARKCLRKNISPEEILWTCGEQNSLFENDSTEANDKQIFKVSADFLALAETIVCYDDAEKWSLLYRLLFRTIHENRNLLHIESDDDVRRARLMERAVYRDIHKFHAFVRFRRVEIFGEEIFAAWHEPHHFTVERSAPFFVRRFGAMRFSIFTPKGCAAWDLENLTFSSAVSKQCAPPKDATEDFWLAYYQAIFNPFRLKIKAMKKELPVRHWRTLPEAVLIPELIRKAKRLESKKKF